MMAEQSQSNDNTNINNNKPKQNVYFNSVTGALIPEGVNESDMYEIDPDDQREQDENQIDQYTDISSKDKQFFKLWNRFSVTQDKSKINMEKALIEFVEKNGNVIIQNELQESLLLHLICLNDYGQINKNSFMEVMKIIERLKKENHNKKD